MCDFIKMLCLVTLLIVIAPNVALAKSDRYNLATDFQSSSAERYVQNNQRVNKWVLAQHQSEQGAKKHKNLKGKHWEDLTPGQRKKIQNRHRRYEELTPVERDRIRKARQHFRELPPERRKELREKWKKMSPEERRKKQAKTKKKMNKYR
jgi:uncharacterized protein DUF3106